MIHIFFGEEKAPWAEPSVMLVPWIYSPRFDVTKFDFDKDLARMGAELGPIVNDNNPDLSAFAAHGGKLILYHGWADSIVSPLDTIDYYNRVGEATPNRDAFVRLFMAPGVGHCMNGAGPDEFGQSADMRAGGDPQHDLIDALDAWIEANRAPESIIATKFDADGKETASRPCARIRKRPYFRVAMRTKRRASNANRRLRRSLPRRREIICTSRLLEKSLATGMAL